MSWRGHPKALKPTKEQRAEKMRLLKTHRGLPDDCPGCLGHGTIEQRSYGRRAGDLKLTCRACGTVYYWSER